VTALLLAAVLSAAPSAEDNLRVGVERYRAGDFERAVTVLEKAATGDSAAVRSKAQLTLGLCFAALQRFDRVDAAFEAALRADPEVQLDPTRVQPALVAMLDAARARLHGDLAVTAPGAAEVSIDGAAAAMPPLEQRVTIGRHHVQVRDAAGHTQERDVVVSADRRAALAFEPPPAATPAAPVQETATAAEAPKSGLNVLVEVRGTLDPRDYTGPLAQPRTAPAPELAVGVGAKYWGATMGIMAGGAFAATLRATGRLPIWGPLAAELSLQGALFFTAPQAVGGTALLGLGVAPLRWLELIVSGGGGVVGGNPALRTGYVLISAALRVRLFS
jgi:hypothetical protein